MHDVDGSSARSRRRMRAAGALVLAAMILVAACGGDDDNDKSSSSGNGGTTTTASGGKSTADVLGPKDVAKGQPVSIGFITDGKNASTDQSVELDVAAAATKYINEHKAGIAGRPIQLTTCEAKLDPAKGTDCANQMIEKGVVAVVVGTTGVVESVWQPLRDAKIPMFFYAASGQKVIADGTVTFTVGSPTAGTIDTPAGLAKKLGKKTVTAIVIDVPAALPSFTGEGAKGFDKYGVKLDLIRVPPGTADMTPQLSRLTTSDPGVVFVLGNDSFCIAAFQGLQSLDVKAPVATISPCITDATRKAVPASYLKGMVMSAQAPIGDEGEATELIRAVEETYSTGFDLSRTAVFGTFMAMTGFDVATENLKGEVTPATITAAIKAMPEEELPGSGGLNFRCNGKAAPATPAVCVRGALVTTLDASGNPTTYEVVGNTPIED